MNPRDIAEMLKHLEAIVQTHREQIRLLEEIKAKLDHLQEMQEVVHG